MTITLDAALVQYAYHENKQLEAKILKQVRVITLACGFALVAAILLAVVSAQENVDAPLFYTPSGGRYLQPQLNTTPQRSFITATAERWASELMTIHFSQAIEQINSRQDLYYQDRFVDEYLTPMRSGMLQTVLDQKAIISAVPACLKQFRGNNGSISGFCGARLDGLYIKDGHRFYDYIVPLIQTRHDLSGKPSSRAITFYLTLISVPQTTRLEGLQIYTSGFNQRKIR